MSKENQSDQRVENLIGAIRDLLQFPSKQEFEALNKKVEELEKKVSGKQRKKETEKKKTSAKQTKTEKLFNVIANHNDSVSIKTLLNETGFEEKTLRNSIQRLLKLGRIKRVKRGVYEKA